MTGATIIRPPVCSDCRSALKVDRLGSNFNRSWDQAIKYEARRQGWTGRRCFDCSNKTRATVPGLRFTRKEIIR